MNIVFFDLDNTLINGDSDYLWGQFLVDQGLESEQEYKTMNDQFFLDYQNGELDIDTYLKFSLRPLGKHPSEELLVLNHEFIETIIQPLIFQQAVQLIEHHKERRDRLVISSSTNSFIVRPIAQLLGINDIISTQVEMIGDEFTGYYVGLPNSNQNKVTNIHHWIASQQLPLDTLANSIGYSDSINDLPLLEMTARSIAVNPDSKLRQIAEQRGWKILSFTE